MHKYDIKINPIKCAFKISVGKFLEFMVTQRGIEANSTEVKVVLESPASTSKKEIQCLTGLLVTLSWFIA